MLHSARRAAVRPVPPARTKGVLAILRHVQFFVLMSLVPATWIHAGLTSAPADVRVSDLRADATGHDLYVSYLITEAFTDEIREGISTGIPVTFTHHFELAKRRTLWLDKTLASKIVTTTVTFDTMTRQYSLTRKVDDEVTETGVAVNEADMMRWMTSLDRVRLADPGALGTSAEDTLYVRVKSQLQRKFVLFFLPWDVETGWERIRLSPTTEPAGRGR